MATLRQKRYNTMKYYYHLLPHEAQELSKIPYSSAPYMKNLLKDRRNLWQDLLKEAEYNKWSYTRTQREWLKWIQELYIKNNWISLNQEYRVGRTKYKADPWAMFRAYRNEAIESDDYEPRKRKKRKYDPTRPHKKLLPNGRIDRSYVNARAKLYKKKTRLLKNASISERARAGDREAMATQLRQRLQDKTLSPEQRSQFTMQLRNMTKNA